MQTREQPTFWQSHRVNRSQYIESKRLKGTHRLKSAERRRNQDNKITVQDRDTHSLGSAEGEADQNTEKKASKRGTLTSWRAQRERQVRTPEESE
jgi:hypothetical protein